MANSKSNIYPIQLQNAELNLNKYDAEIKQYSGFNKNNAPFVGGCLSNVFTKEEQISGGNADNTYIDTNGNVYRVDTDGLYKNDNKIIKFSDTTKFYQKRKLKYPTDAVKAISEDIYITVENGVEYYESAAENGQASTTVITTVYIAHWGNGYKQLIAPVFNTDGCFLEITKKGNKIVFSCKLKRSLANDGVTALNYIVYVPNENEEECYRYSPSNGSTFYLNNITTPYANYSQAVFIDDDAIYYAQNEANDGSGLIRMDYAQFGLNYQKYNTFNTTVPVPSWWTQSDQIVCSNNFGSYYMTNQGYFYLYKAPAFTLGTASSERQGFYIHFKLKIRYEESGFVIKKTCYFNYLNANNKTLRIYYCKGNNMSPYYAFYLMDFTDANDSTKGNYESICDSFRNVVYSIDTNGTPEIVTGGTYFYEGFKILINNGVVTNISIAEYDEDSFIIEPYEGKSLHGIIVEDWNVIKDFAIYDGKCVYITTDNQMYVIEQTENVNLKLKNGQLVINCNQEQNCYSLLLDKVLHFGSDWNTSYLVQTTVVYYLWQAYYNTKPTANNQWIASAINEHNRKYNPSLILNMQNVYVYNNYDYQIFVGFNTVERTSTFIIRYMETSAVNIYMGETALNNAYYRASGCISYQRNPDLYGQIFPNQTDGNIPYNPNLFSDFIQNFGIDIFVKNDNNVYQLMKDGQDNIMSFYLGTLIEGLELVFILQGQYYGVINNKLFSFTFVNGVLAESNFLTNIQGLQFCGNTPYEALFFSKTNRCLYSFTGANVLNQKQLVDKISEVRDYLYNPATQTVFLITDIGVLFYGLFGMFLLEYTDITNIFLLDNGIVLCDNEGNYRYIRYYKEDTDEDYIKQNIKLETCFYGMNDQTVTINDCLYLRLFSEEHEEGEVKISASTISLKGRKTEETTFKYKASDWDKLTHTIYMRYQPKNQRGLGISFSIESPFKIASMSVGSQADAILVDKISKGAINAPFTNKSSTIEW